MQAAGSLLSAGLGIGSGISAMNAAKTQQKAANLSYQAGMKALPTGPGIGPQFEILSGQQQQQAYDDQANSLGQEATYALQTSLLQAGQNDYQTTKVQAEQDAQFSASGVTLQGSPLGILTETQQLGNQVSNQIRLQGQLQSQLYSEQGLQMLRQGSAAAFAGQANALSDQYNYELSKAQAMSSLYGANVQASAAASAQKSAAIQGIGTAAGLAFSGLGALGGRGGSGGGGGSWGAFGPSANGMSMGPLVGGI